MSGNKPSFFYTQNAYLFDIFLFDIQLIKNRRKEQNLFYNISQKMCY